MAAARKRPRNETDESRAECPFSIRLVDPKEKEQKGKKRRKRESEEDDGAKRIMQQLSPFAPNGKFKTHETMDVHYMVDPSKKWSDMTRYNSFVLNGVKYFSEGFIYVANESTIERQKAVSGKEQMQPRKKSDDDWVARILEIRASDEHHVYARVYWMYWPDELPAGTHDGKKTVQGRQPYHGKVELIASNHMDIINVVSVTSQAQVNQMIEDNDDDVQNSLYWRQAIDVRTFELSTVEPICKCGQPANPDKVLIGCVNEGCGKWLHEECLKHETLMKTFELLGKDKPHVSEEPKKDDKVDEEAGRPLSPTETGAAVSAKPSIDVYANGDDDAEQGTVRVNDNVEVGQADEAATSVASRSRVASADSGAKEDNGVDTPTKATPGRKGPGRPRKHPKPESVLDSSRPYESLFEASPRMDLNPPMMEVTDLRNIEGGDKSWMVPMHCLVCSAQLV